MTDLPIGDSARGQISASSDWARAAFSRLAEMALATPSPLIQIPASDPMLTILIKDESVQPTGSIKARLALRLIEDAIREGRVGASTCLVDVSSGSTAIAEAAVAQRLGLAFTAVLPRGTTPRKIAEIESYGASVEFAESLEAAREKAADLGSRKGACYLDQFGRATSALSDRGQGSLAGELFSQVREASGGSDPTALFLTVGTGGSLAALAGAARHGGLRTRICLADPAASDLHHIWARSTPPCVAPIHVEGIGGRARPGFRPDLVDSACPVTDADSFAAARMLSILLGKPVGGSTGTAFWALCKAAADMRAAERLVLVSILYDDGRRYADTIYSDAWLKEQQLDIAPGMEFLARVLALCSAPIAL